ncbi:MAG: hypothetical protein OEW60_05035, partial [Thiovulaceae bacterium]|nr:hypothetical protein [Sulfurimonadaceae bacterium]
FQWEKQKNETFSILFSKKFLTLKSYYAFVKKVESFEQELTKNYPKIKLLQNSYLDDLTLKVTVTQKNRTRRRSRRGGLHE